jgi:hypothetical protein
MDGGIGARAGGMSSGALQSCSLSFVIVAAVLLRIFSRAARDFIV